MMNADLPDLETTLAVAAEFAQTLNPGDVVALCGGLGAGKTHFSKGIVSGLGCVAAVSSPTFTLVQEYHGGRLPVYHFDLYRLESPTELLGIGWDDYLDAGGVCLVEWADKFPALLPGHTQWLQFHVTGEQSRRVETADAPSVDHA
jgi:tRNA threonylcarbamoyladenosine biosynthesis protein TsaE